MAIDATLRPDASLRVVEHRTFDYRGTYRGAFYTLPLRGGQEVTDFALSDSTGVTYRLGSFEAEAPGTYAIEQSGDEFEVTWFYGWPASDEQRTYTLTYTVTRAAVRHADVAELYWQWVGDEWSVPTGRLTADVTLPAGEEPLEAGRNLLIWGHGPRHGVVQQVAPDVVRTAVTSLPARTFVELRALMPAGLLAEAPSDGRTVREEIVAEENRAAAGAAAPRGDPLGRPLPGPVPMPSSGPSWRPAWSCGWWCSCGGARSTACRPVCPTTSATCPRRTHPRWWGGWSPGGR